jgi:hypothetical protein
MIMRYISSILRLSVDYKSYYNYYYYTGYYNPFAGF